MLTLDTLLGCQERGRRLLNRADPGIVSRKIARVA
jgi:hypothetical protein